MAAPRPGNPAPTTARYTMSSMPAPLPAQACTDFCLALAQETEYFQAFSRLLDEEAALLAAPHDAEAVRAMAEQKQAYAERLHACEQRRLQLAAELLPDMADAPARLQQLRLTPAVEAAWLPLADAAQAAHDRNRRNGIVLGVHLKHVDQAIQAMRQANQQTELYDAQGRTARGRSKASGAGRYHRAG